MKSLCLGTTVFLALMTLSACNNDSDHDSVFEFFPRSKSELKAKGYKSVYRGGVYYSFKSIADTLDRFTEDNPGSGSFLKEVIVKTLSKDNDTVRKKSEGIKTFVREKAEEVIFDHYNFLIVRMRKKYFYITVTVSGSLSALTITYSNLHYKSGRDQGVDHLENLKKIYPDSINRKKIAEATAYLENFKE